MKQLFVVYVIRRYFGESETYRKDLFLTYDEKLARNYVEKAEKLKIKAKEIYTKLYLDNQWEDDTMMDKYHEAVYIDYINYAIYKPKQLEIR
jgi:hypothetical protein